MTYTETLDYLYARLPAYHRIGPAAYKNNLDNTWALMAGLGHPERQFTSIHVAGTNGKGSVSSMLTSVLMAAGYERVGLYTSPHLLSFGERIRIDGQCIDPAFVVQFVAQHQGLIESINPSFFELTVAMAYSYYAQQQCSVVVVEVGLGGRLDSTNVIVPAMSVITNISHDHMELLGNSLAAIAGEKAGIIKAGVPVVVGQQHPETWPVFVQQATRVGAPLHWAGEDYNVELKNWTPQGQVFAVIEHGIKSELHCDLLGAYQAENIRTVLASVAQLRAQGWALPQAALLDGLATVRQHTGLRGRMEVMGQAPLVLADVAHNAAGLAAVLAQVHALPHQRLHVVLGVVNDKDVTNILNQLPKTASYYWVNAAIPRALPAGELALQANAVGLVGRAVGAVAAGLHAAHSAAMANDIILVTGSFFVVAEVLEKE